MDCQWQTVQYLQTMINVAYNKKSGLAYIDHTNWVSFVDYWMHFIFTSTQKASHSLFIPNHVEVEFFSGSTKQIFFIDEKVNIFFVDTARRVSQNHIATN